ncbi:30S ribosomal protein S3 [Candidatus Woesearchaeota archaeon]|nr:30S ribosomal protein S3 [Candidatus Woesearchaeota archaeon]
MIERKILAQKIKEFEVEEFITMNLPKIGHSHTKLQRTPLGDKVIITASRPGLVVGKKGQSIKKLTIDLKKRFNLENPQIEIADVQNQNLDPKILAEKLETSLEKFGINRFKALGHKIMMDAMNAGALGIEVLISGKVPSSRAKVWRFYQGYLKKCGDVAETQVKKAYAAAKLKSGVVGIQVRIMPPDVKLPDHVELFEEKVTVTEELPAKSAEENGSVSVEAQGTLDAGQKAEEKAAKPKRQRKKAVKKDKVNDESKGTQSTQ